MKPAWNLETEIRKNFADLKDIKETRTPENINTLEAEIKIRQLENQLSLIGVVKRALDILENSHKSIFITGRAGTGKSTLLDYFRRNTHKKLAVLAPTGVAP